MSSQSKFEIIFTFVGTDSVVIGEIIRFQAPQTFEALQDKTREKGFYTVRSRANIGRVKSYWMVLVDLQRGGEKNEYKESQIGDIVYCPRQDAIYLIYDTPTLTLPVYYLGKIKSGIESLPNMRNGTMVKITFKEI
ncbi:hypothetical protein NEF87_004245 [Candidatus Lokiarchaeum ossiferum]|uniref:Cyclophilin TM1367-like domain-containing protein n=1 Tax=Candidatus Lokiarchaeum ossiferum TaxID=2951803 RepID=A0ABY6HX11_9ARCH|nr:hypothetical protein NEF87_004245 [Candidatus Lokiarchaeum sp. B-35]